MDKGQENQFPIQHPYTVSVKYNLQDAGFKSSLDSEGRV